MYIHNSTIHTLGGYELDTSKIERKSIDKQGIKLPYTGELPDTLSNTSGAAISFNVNMERANVLLEVQQDGKPRRFSLQASVEEINAVLQPFFMREDGYTRFDNGLSRYWLGYLQADYLAWKKINQHPATLAKIIRQMKPSDKSAILNRIEREDKETAYKSCR